MAINSEFSPPPEAETNRTLRTRLQKWVLERLMIWPPKPMEAKARWHIAQAVIKDINQPNYLPNKVTQNTTGSINRLVEMGVNGGTPLIITNDDLLHPEEEFNTRFRRDEEKEMWVAEELNAEGNIIVRACIGDRGETILTINPHGDRFTIANPNISERRDLPRATVATFNLLVGSIRKK